MSLNPPPDVVAWAAIEDPYERLRSALEQLYAYYRRTEHMLENLHRDEASMPIVKQLFGGFRAYLEAARDALMTGRQARGRSRRLLRAAIGHALAFPTWLSLTREQGLDDSQAADLMHGLALASAQDASRTRRPG
jgi:hypothetical protein